jgi:hypothetical protein
MPVSSRREFIAAASAGVIVAAASPSAVLAQRQLDQYDVLIQGQFANRLRLLQQVGGQFLQVDFTLGGTGTDWRLQLGRYRGRVNDRPVNVTGYWIYHPDSNVNKCWQAGLDNGQRPLRYWNNDGRAAGSPEDWELFTFEAVNRQDMTVKIRNSRFPLVYVSLVGTRFDCNGRGARQAAIFKVEFPNPPTPPRQIAR